MKRVKTRRSFRGGATLPCFVNKIMEGFFTDLFAVVGSYSGGELGK